MADFPHDSLGYPLQSGYGMEIDAGLSRTKFASGDTRQRRNRRSFPAEITLQFNLDTRQLELFQYFAQNYGFDWFNLSLMVPDAGVDVIKQKSARFISNYTIAAKSYNYSTVSVRAEIRDASIPSSGPRIQYCEPYYTSSYYTRTA